MATQRKIAAMLDLSPGTVSRALRDIPGIDPNTRARVKAAAASMGYRAKPDAKSPNGNGTDNQLIGLIIDADPAACGADGIFIRFLQGASEAARELDVSLHVDYVSASVKERYHLRENHSAVLRNGMVRGVVLVGLFPPQVVKSLTRDYEVIRLNVREPGINVDCIAQDDYHAVNLLMEHLLSAGKREIGFLSAPSDMDYTFARSRFAGYLESVTLHNLELDPARWIGIRGTENFSVHVEQVLTQIKSGVTSWICVNDVWAYRLQGALMSAGLKPNSDFGVCGFDGNPAPEGQPPVVSIAWPFEDMGVAAVKQLVQRLKNPTMTISSQVFQGRILIP